VNLNYAITLLNFSQATSDFEELDVRSSPFSMFILSNVRVSLGNPTDNKTDRKESFSPNVFGCT